MWITNPFKSSEAADTLASSTTASNTSLTNTRIVHDRTGRVDYIQVGVKCEFVGRRPCQEQPQTHLAQCKFLEHFHCHPSPAVIWTWPQILTNHLSSTLPLRGYSARHLDVTDGPNFYSLRDGVNASLSLQTFSLSSKFPLKSSQLAIRSDKKLTECLSPTCYFTQPSKVSFHINDFYIDASIYTVFLVISLSHFTSLYCLIESSSLILHSALFPISFPVNGFLHLPFPALQPQTPFLL